MSSCAAANLGHEAVERRVDVGAAELDLVHAVADVKVLDHLDDCDCVCVRDVIACMYVSVCVTCV